MYLYISLGGDVQFISSLRGVAALRGPGGQGPPNNLANSKIYIYAVAWGEGPMESGAPPIILTLLRLCLYPFTISSGIA